MKSQILIKCGNNWFEFSKSKTGQLDYEGKWQSLEAPQTEGWQKVTSSPYFNPGWYLYLDEAENFDSEVYVAPGVDVSDKDILSYLVHIGPVLAAVEAKDSFLAGELYLRRKDVFDNFAQLTAYILEDLNVEILFSHCFGKLHENDHSYFDIIFKSVKKKIGFDPSKESLEQAYIRWFKENEVTLTLPLVGNQFYNWENEPAGLMELNQYISPEDVLSSAEKIRKAKHDFYAGLKVSVQAEPYNQYDDNSVLVCIESTDGKLTGNGGMEKAGHIRALAAKIFREAKPEKIGYGGKLQSLSFKSTVVKIIV